MIRGNLSLPELAQRYNISDIYGATIAYFSSEQGGSKDLRSFKNTICCYELNLVRQGKASVVISGEEHELRPGSLLLLTPYQPAECHFPPGVISEGILVDNEFFDSIIMDPALPETNLPALQFNYVYYLTPAEADEVSGIMQQIRMAIQNTHTNKETIIRMLAMAFDLYIRDLPLNMNISHHASKHKEILFRKFLYIAEHHFRTERLSTYYAEKLNVSPTYLNRVVREISGNTVSEHLIRMVFHEGCNLLLSTDKSIGEIADQLHFHDQSAFANFFHAHAGCSPSAYRGRHQS